MNARLVNRWHHEKIIWTDLQICPFPELSHSEKKMILSWRNHDSVRKWMNNQSILSLEDHCEFIKKLADDSSKFYWLIKDRNGDSIGIIDLVQVNWEHHRSCLGLYKNPNTKIPGIGTKLMKIIEWLAFNDACLNSLRLEVHEKNIVAISLYKKMGYIEEGCLHNYLLIDGIWHNLILMAKINERAANES